MGRTSHLTKEDFRQQAEFRFMLRHFLKSAEFNARSHGLEPAQFQLLLAVRGMPSDEPPNVTSVAQRLLVETHTVVELVDKMIEKGMMERFREGKDRRCVYLRLTPLGEVVLEKVALLNRRALSEYLPQFMDFLEALQRTMSAESTDERRMGA